MKKIALLVSGLSLAVLVACGGGGGGAKDESKDNKLVESGDNGTGGKVTPVTLSITAAKGLAMVGATVTVTDANGTPSTCTGTTDKDGKLSCTLPATFTAPFVIMAQLDDEKQYSVIPTGGSSSVNVTPLTTVVVAGLSSSGDPAQFASEVKADKTKASADAVKVQVTQLNTNLRAVIDFTVGKDSQLDPMAGELQANTGTGQDKLLDTVKVSITAPDTANGVAAKQVISLKADPDATVTISKDSTDPKPEPISSSKVAATEDVTKVNPAVLVADLMTRMNACYALPVAQRVNTQGTGVAADIKADACINLFVGNTPANFKSGGALVGAKGAFKTLFSSLADGVVFDRGNLEYVVRNKDAANDGVWVVSYRSTDKANNISYGNFALKNENGVLKQAGNQYDHDASVASFVQDREFINDPDSSYLSTGYALIVTNKVDGKGDSIYRLVTVTTPKNRKLYLKPAPGCSTLGLALASGTVNCTSFARLNYGYKNASKTDDIPEKERSNLFFVPFADKYQDSELVSIPDQGTWKFEIEFADASKPKVTQLHRTLSRAPTLGELRKTVFADLTSKARTDLVKNTKDVGAYVFTQHEYAQLGGGSDGDFWTVPGGAAAPTNIKIYGRAPTVGSVSGNQFDDATTVLASARSALIKCSRLSNADNHCENNVTVGASGFYAAGASATDLQLHANLPGNSTRSKHFAFYYPNPGGGSGSSGSSNLGSGGGGISPPAPGASAPTPGASAPTPGASAPSGGGGSSGSNAPLAPAGTKTLADFAGTYNITAVWQAKGGSDGTYSDTSNGTVQINASGTVASCSVGRFIQCSGGFTLNAKKDGVTFSIPASGGTLSGTLSGTVNSTYVLNGSLSGNDSDDGSTLTGTLTGQKATKG